MKNMMRILLATLVATVATGCTSAFYTAGSSAYDDLYASHNRTEIANRQKAEAEVRVAEAEARKAEAEALQAEYEAKIAAYNAKAAAEGKQTIKVNETTADGVIVLEEQNSTRSFVADSYESAYARRLKGFKSVSYRMPSSYFNLRYNGNILLATAYDPSFYNVMVSGDEVWVEPRYITSMFGTWGATNATALIYSPWYYGWSPRWSMSWGIYDPWYYSSWGFPRYSWYDWNWNICYGGGWGHNLWWGWGGHYHPWRPAPHHHHYNPHHWGGVVLGPGNIAGGGHWHGSLRGTRLDNGPASASANSQSLRKPTMVKQGAINSSSAYRSPNSGSAYDSSIRRGTVSNAILQQQQEVQSSSSRAQSSSNRSGNVSSRSAQTVGRSNSALINNSRAGSMTQNNSSSSNNRNSSSQSNSSSSSNNRSTSSYNSSSSSSFSSGSSSRSGGGYSGGSVGGAARSGGSRGR